MSSINYSPLRYPGGKSLLGAFMTDVIILNGLQKYRYHELYAGGAGAALYLLLNDVVEEILINDADYRVYCFWYSLLYNSGNFLKKFDSCTIDINEWEIQKNVYENYTHENVLNIGFATFFLNRTNRSGILHKAGPIGGKTQTGNYLLNARFNKISLREKLLRIIAKAGNILLYNIDTEDFLLNKNLYDTKRAFFYLDPPYYYKGKELYYNNYNHEQHLFLSDLIINSKIKNWVISYDDAEPIKEMYNEYRKANFDFNYSLQEKRQATELMIFSDKLKVPEGLIINTKEQPLILF